MPSSFRPILPVLGLLSLVLLLTSPALAVDPDDTRLLHFPAVSADHVVFAYAGDLWVADAEGEHPRRLTNHPGDELLPTVSPDGRHVAFSGKYDGNLDVYIVPITGGVPERLTWHPRADFTWGFTADSGGVLFGSPRRHPQGDLELFTVAVDGGFPERLPVPRGYDAALSPDGGKIAYSPASKQFRQWKNYRGGTTSRIWIQDLENLSVTEIPRPADRPNDTEPMWIGDQVYFLSDRGGEFNLFRFAPASGVVTQLTHHEDFPILDAAAGGGRILYEQAGYLHVFDPASAASRRLEIGIAADLLAVRPRFTDAGDDIRNFDLSPSGARAVFEARGEIVTVPAEKGDVRHLTGTRGVHERSPVWSPDGTKIAYFSDAAGEYALHIVPQDGRGEPRIVELGGAGFYDTPRFAPDGTKLSYIDNSWSLYVLDLESGEAKKIHSEVLYGPVRTLHHAWSPDSRWLAYTEITETYLQKVALYNVEDGQSRTITDGLADVGEPVFDAGGQYLYLTASTDAGPARQWFAMSNADADVSRALYLAVLPSGVVSPLAKKSDEEEAKTAEENGDGKDGKGEGNGEDEENGDDVIRVEVDLDGLHERIISLPVEPAFVWNLEPGPAGKLFYLKGSDPVGLFGQPAGELMVFDLEKREAEELASGVTGFVLSNDRKKILANINGGFTIADAGSKLEPGEGQLATDAIRLKIDPRAEWRQIFNEAWRINRDYFYDPGMHGADWPAMREKYAVFLDDLAVRDDLDRVLQWMSSELAVGHHRVCCGDQLHESESIPGGLLGADFEIDQGKYRFAKVYGGLNWNPQLRSPLTEPGVEVEAGDYLLAVDGEPVDAAENLYHHFEATAGRIVELEVGPAPSGEGSRVVHAVPIESEWNLRNRDWVEANLRRVEEATDGRVAYVYVPNTAGLGHTYFKRYFYPQADREAIIVDERSNGGGQVADYYIDILRRPLLAFWTTRYGQTVKTPIAGIHGPKVMLIDELAGSGGDFLPWTFRELELGPLIGKRTWGGLVGILGFPTLLDGGRITAPNLAFWTPEEGYGIENVGVPPDIEVEQWPAEVEAGRDPQLERAIEEILRMLEETPAPEIPEPPPFPVRARPSR